MANYLLKEDDSRILQEDDSKILLENSSEYTKGDEVSLPTNSADLETQYTEQNYTDVSTYDGIRVGQTGTGQYMIHQFKDFVMHDIGFMSTWKGRSSLAPSLSIVKLQLYNNDTTTWDDIDSNNSASANTDFTLSASINNPDGYVDQYGMYVFRVYQLAL